MSTATIEQTANVITSGDFCWYELMTPNPESAQAFYSSVLGWKLKDAGVPGMNYGLIHVGDTQIGGIMEVQPGAEPGWRGYIAADDVDAQTERVRQMGGTVHRQPGDIPGVGRFSVVADPHGAVFFLFHGNTSAPPRMDPAAPGAVSWQELRAGSLEQAWKFYEDMFGWQKSQAFDMGPMGVYQTFSTNKVQPMTGGMMTNAEGSPAMWVFTFTVADIKQAIERVRSAGGTVRMGPVQVPGGRWTAQCADPQGVSFGMLAER